MAVTPKTSTELVELIRKRHPSPAWVTLAEVRNGTGFSRGKTRTADALSFSVWPSNGLAIHGFEVKVSRSDLIKELSDPAKAAEFSKWCDYWWLVVSKVQFVESVAIPESWGVLFEANGVLKVHKHPNKREREPIDILFVCAVMRSVQEGLVAEYVKRSDIEAETQAKIKRAVEDHRDSRQWDHDRLATKVADFESASGIKLEDFRADEIGHAVKLVREIGAHEIRHWVEYQLPQIDRLRQQFAEYLDHFKQVQQIAKAITE